MLKISRQVVKDVSLIIGDFSLLAVGEAQNQRTKRQDAGPHPAEAGPGAGSRPEETFGSRIQHPKLRFLLFCIRTVRRCVSLWTRTGHRQMLREWYADLR